MKDCLIWEETHAGAREECESEEAEAETMCDELIRYPILHPSLLEGKKEKLGVKLRKKEGVGMKVF